MKKTHYKVSEISKMTGISVNTIKARLRRGKYPDARQDEISGYWLIHIKYFSEVLK